LAQNDLFRLQHVMHAITLTGINYGVLTESKWEGRRAVKLSPKVPGVFLRKNDLETGFDDDGLQISPLAVRITADLPAVDALLKRAGWQRHASTTDPLLHHLISGNHGEGALNDEFLQAV
ncbi:hypothetical protein QMM04_21510, partial [Pantoea sp. Pa-EAmG]|nr:hypothetical protein [Pantoea sp. Pa-EAmG]